jgi:hypothetical protein
LILFFLVSILLVAVVVADFSPQVAEAPVLLVALAAAVLQHLQLAVRVTPQAHLLLVVTLLLL